MATNKPDERNFDNLGDREVPDQPTIIVPGNEWRPRVRSELAEVTERLVRLLRFKASEEFFKLSARQRDLLRKQSSVMIDYIHVLTERLGS